MKIRSTACFIVLGLAVGAADTSDPIERIKDEGLSRSQAMSFLTSLTDEIGPRVSGSPEMERARAWARSKLAEIGLANIHLEPWGKGPVGWRLRRFSAEVIEPQCIP
jgi:carboxypeptidase Q